MSPFNLENNMRSKMRDRELEPSSAAWEKLEKRLDAATPKKKFPAWIYAVAAVLLVVFISSIFTKDHLGDDPQIVLENSNDNPYQVTPEHDVSREVVYESAIEKTEIEVVVKEPATPAEITETLSHQPILTESSIVSEQKSNQEMVANVAENSDEFWSQKAADVAGNIRDLYEAQDEVSIDEVEALMEQARRDILTGRILKNSKTDAMALLNEVEWELDKTFYDKVFYALGENFKKLATAYAERNK